MVTTLLIDTSSEAGFVAIGRDDTVLFVVPLLGRQGAQELVPTLKMSLEEHAMTLQELSRIAVAIGPGSYTGLRIGVIIAKTLAYSLNLPIIGVPSLSLYAPMPPFQGHFAVLVDARMGGAYVAKGVVDGSKVATEPSRLLPLDELPAFLHDTFLLITPHRQRLHDRLKASSLVSQPWQWHDSIADSSLMLQKARELPPSSPHILYHGQGFSKS